jgi:hypothetical protein
VKVTQPDLSKIEEEELSIRDLLSAVLHEARKTNFYLALLAQTELKDEDARRL